MTFHPLPLYSVPDLVFTPNRHPLDVFADDYWQILVEDFPSLVMDVFDIN